VNTGEPAWRRSATHGKWLRDSRLSPLHPSVERLTVLLGSTIEHVQHPCGSRISFSQWLPAWSSCRERSPASLAGLSSARCRHDPRSHGRSSTSQLRLNEEEGRGATDHSAPWGPGWSGPSSPPT